MAASLPAGMKLFSGMIPTGSGFAAEESSLFLNRLFDRAASYTFDSCYVKSADNSFDLFLDRKYFKYFAFAHESHNSGADFGLDNRHFSTS